uniref:Uncharacterized protein n=1 Tax=Grammatophora oceanica TaxID=210454 RepID=A0A7S1YHU1_9STRA|mmetsp:Transcript_4741/g.6593  ORF Transcript_4741/g.6593 Transcript_4741/m.6593 type:complete len:205 (+) Transcript_4741:68-682(+)
MASSSDDLSALTLDSSFPENMRKESSKEKTPQRKSTRSRQRVSVKKEDSTAELEELEKVSAHLAKMKLSLRIQQLQEKVKLAKMIEDVYDTVEEEDQELLTQIMERDEESQVTGRTYASTASSRSGSNGERRRIKGDRSDRGEVSSTDRSIRSGSTSLDPPGYNASSMSQSSYQSGLECSNHSAASRHSNRSRAKRPGSSSPRR